MNKIQKKEIPDPQISPSETPVKGLLNCLKFFHNLLIFFFFF